MATGARAGARARGASRERARRALRARQLAGAARASHDAGPAAWTRCIAVTRGTVDVAHPRSAVGKAMAARAVQRASAGGGARELAVAARAVRRTRRGSARRSTVARGARARPTRAGRAGARGAGSRVRDGRAPVGATGRRGGAGASARTERYCSNHQCPEERTDHPRSPFHDGLPVTGTGWPRSPPWCRPHRRSCQISGAGTARGYGVSASATPKADHPNRPLFSVTFPQEHPTDLWWVP